MAKKKQLIVFCNDYLGGVANFYRNILQHISAVDFEIKTIFLRWEELDFTLLTEKFDVGTEIEYTIRKDKDRTETAREISSFIDDGVVITNFEPELNALHYASLKNNKVIYICHDELNLARAYNYSFLIDVFIAHNIFFYEQLTELLPHRKKDIHYLPYGIKIVEYDKKVNINKPLRIVWLARIHQLKGIYDIPEIDSKMKENGVTAEWTIIGNGPDREAFQKIVEGRNNFRHCSPISNSEVTEILKEQDVFVLPSQLDGLPVAMLETMSMGIVPVLYEFNPGIRRIVNDDMGYIVPVHDKEAMVAAILKLNGDREGIKKMAIKNMSFVKENYNIKTQVEKYSSLFFNAPKSDLKGSWLPYWKINGKRFHPLIPVFLRKMLFK